MEMNNPHEFPGLPNEADSAESTTAASAHGISRRSLMRAALAAPVAALASRTAFADDFPSRPLHMIVPFPAGGSSDALSRIGAAALSSQLAQSVVVENRGGAGGNIAADYLARSPADGYTLLVAGQAIMAINKALYSKISYDPQAFAYVGMLGNNANVLLSNPKVLPARNVAELIALAKAQPGKIPFGSNGIGSLSHLTAEVFAAAAGVKFLHVPYRGAAPMATDLRAGRIAFCFTGSTLAVSLANTGALLALAVTTAQRIDQLKDTPTLVESGFPMLDAPSWWALMATPGTPGPVLAKLRKAFAAAAATPAYQTALRNQATLPALLPPEKADAFFAHERQVWTSAVKSSGARAE
jgi:tripartite-type tricarboxylate transporter receptor subunit TctC